MYGLQLRKPIDDMFPLRSLNSTFQHYGHYSAGKKLPAKFQLDFLCPVCKTHDDVFNYKVLPSTSGGKLKAITTACIVLGGEDSFM